MTKVRLGEVEYELKPLPLKKARMLREQISGKIEGIAETLKKLENVELTQMDDLGALIGSLGGTLAGSMELISDWLFEFSPELRKDRELIEETAFDNEMLKAFGEMLKMLYPFGGALESLSGLAAQATSMNLHSASGGSGQTKSIRQP